MKCRMSPFHARTRFERSYSSCTGRSSENLCSSSRGAQEKKKDRVKLRKPFTAPLNTNVLFRRFFKNLTLCMTKLRILVLSFPDFTISLMYLSSKRGGIFLRSMWNVSFLQESRDILGYKVPPSMLRSSGVLFKCFDGEDNILSYSHYMCTPKCDEISM